MQRRTKIHDFAQQEIKPYLMKFSIPKLECFVVALHPNRKNEIDWIGFYLDQDRNPIFAVPVVGI